MKKSDMIKILVCDIKDTEGWSYEKRANFIICSMEARGMLPPLRAEKIPLNKVCMPSHLCDLSINRRTFDTIISSRTWEPEDE